MTEDYQHELGERLRSIRNMQGLTLQDVEERSEGRWKAVVIGSYERGDRAVSVAKLADLAAFYNVPVRELLPTHIEPALQREPGTGDLTVDLTALDAEDDGAVGAVSRYARRIQLERGDYNGRVLTIRAEDVAALAAACGLVADDLRAELDRRRMLTRSR